VITKTTVHTITTIRTLMTTAIMATTIMTTTIMTTTIMGTPTDRRTIHRYRIRMVDERILTSRQALTDPA
jgi:hypothetical protein